MATCGELVSTHMLKKSWVENWLHKCQLLVSVMLPLGGTVALLPKALALYHTDPRYLYQMFHNTSCLWAPLHI